MSFVIDDDVKLKLGEEWCRALMNAVEVKKRFLSKHLLVSHQVGLIKEDIMGEIANALGPRIRDAHKRRMGEGAKADQFEIMKVSSIRHLNSNLNLIISCVAQANYTFEDREIGIDTAASLNSTHLFLRCSLTGVVGILI